MRGTGKCGLHAQRQVGMVGSNCMCVCGLDGAAVGMLGGDAGDCGSLVRECRVGSNEVSHRACVEDSRGCWREEA